MEMNSLLHSPAISYQELSLVKASQNPTNMENRTVGQPVAT